jgi:hypothetical protein
MHVEYPAISENGKPTESIDNAPLKDIKFHVEPPENYIYPHPLRFEKTRGVLQCIRTFV